jgi:hypothetical protein
LKFIVAWEEILRHPIACKNGALKRGLSASKIA